MTKKYVLIGLRDDAYAFYPLCSNHFKYFS